MGCEGDGRAGSSRYDSRTILRLARRPGGALELVNGQPLRMRARAKNVHDEMVVTLVGELREQVRGTRYRPFTGDGSIETRPGQIRRPNVGVDCGPRDPNGTKKALPRRRGGSNAEYARLRHFQARRSRGRGLCPLVRGERRSLFGSVPSWMRPLTVGIPNGRAPPSPFGISARRDQKEAASRGLRFDRFWVYVRDLLHFWSFFGPTRLGRRTQ